MEAYSFNLQKMPFSRYGTFISISAKDGKNFYIHCSRRPFGEDKVFKVSFFAEGAEVIPTASFYPDELILSRNSSSVSAYINGENSLVLVNRGFDLTLQLIEIGRKNGDTPEDYPLAYGSQVGSDHMKVISVNARYCIGIHVYSGHAELSGPYKKNERGEQIDNKSIVKVSPDTVIEIDISPKERHPSDYHLPDLATMTAAIRADWMKFLSGMPEVPDHYHDSAIRSWFNIWASFVPASGNYHYPAVVMSKEFMSSVWSWDHCFNALALSKADPVKALQQFFIMFDHQADNGVLPDYVNPDLEIVWGVTKPPVHGWCFSKIMEEHSLDETVLRKAYDHLVKWTNWWMDYSDSDMDGIPEYAMGCDSGWDNATVFDLGYFVESPDLSAYLVLQMNTLSKLAFKLGLDKESEAWKDRATDLLKQLDEHSWTEKGYVAKLSGSHESDENPTSLITRVPLVLGHLMESHKRKVLIESIKKDFLTEFGMATEAYRGPYYKDDNYWRGAIWAPYTLLIVDGLLDAGEKEMALDIARRFCDLVAFVAEGDYENFDALTGKGLRACGYTWTSSVNILLLNLLKKNEIE